MATLPLLFFRLYSTNYLPVLILRQMELIIPEIEKMLTVFFKLFDVINALQYFDVVRVAIFFILNH